ncbi:hypothetical protein [Amycolatopsis vancoresmycina]|uniref:Uncharacterized protein n=1 Tax=Amycolatopsis vancoresmycina DSM 44592 TaxID=1292037 RepID=R1I3I0_9PSEU|nr:hypothetical protein [Amycolatopsis vancoresmycina]EOD70360.1 hypothetical protein H480_01552 [Amycolatopsis vancoresmycina DSM 44592]
MTTTLDLTEFRGWPAADRAAFCRAFVKATGQYRGGIASVIDQVIGALSPATANTVEIDTSGVQARNAASACAVLLNFGGISPGPAQPLPAFRTFVKTLLAADVAVSAAYKAAGYPTP